MKTQLTEKDVSLAVKTAVAELISRRAIAEVTRERVDEVQREVLAYIPLFDDLSAKHEDREPERITDPARVYLSEDDASLTRFYKAVHLHLRAHGLKPLGMDPDHCPALTAEYEQTKAEWALLDAATEMLDLDFGGKELNHRLLCRKGLGGRQEMLDLLCKLVTSLDSPARR